MKNLKTKFDTRRAEGFTIIEVMIVLAVAGLILLIVFLAVPALQRNSRNTQIRNDAAAVLGAVNEFASNNNGTLPVWVCANSSGTIYMDKTGTAPGSCAGTTAQQAGLARLNQLHSYGPRRS